MHNDAKYDLYSVASKTSTDDNADNDYHADVCDGQSITGLLMHMYRRQQSTQTCCNSPQVKPGQNCDSLPVPKMQPSDLLNFIFTFIFTVPTFSG